MRGPNQNSVRTVSKMEKGILLFMLIFIQACIFVPVWQAGENRSLSVAMQNTTRNITLLEEQQRVLQTQIAKAQMPENLIDSAVEMELYFQQIAPEQVVHVASLGGGQS